MAKNKKIVTKMSEFDKSRFELPKSENLQHVVNPIQTSAQQQALSNSLVVRKIQSYLSPMEILNLRPLNRSFEEEATSFLLSNEKAGQKFHIKFTWECSADHPHRPDLGHYEHLYMGSLSEFLDDCWKTSRRFPVLNFSFDYCSGWTRDLLDFFANVGKYIQGLSINPSSSSQHQENSLQLLAYMLFGLTPNLKHLTLISTPWSPYSKILDSISTADNEWDDKRRVIPALETLTLQGQGSNYSFGVVRDILESAPNLREVLDPELNFIHVLTASKKLHLGSKIIEWDVHQENFYNFCVFAMARPRHLREISLKLYDVLHRDLLFLREIGTALTNIFHGSSCSLEKIGKLPFLDKFPHMDPLPVMEKVEEAQFYQPETARSNYNVEVLPDGNTLQQVFPRLKTLRLFDLCADERFNPLFQPPEIHGHHGVTTLELTPEDDSTSVEQPTWIQSSASLFPSMTTLEIKINGLNILPAIFPAIWTHLERLEHLKVSAKFQACLSFMENLPGETDSAITGIPLIACNLLRINLATKGRESGENSDHGHLRQHPSILNMHKLKTFRINVLTPVVKFKQMFTSVSIIYAFEPMFKRQQLRASVGLMENPSYQMENGTRGVSAAEKEFLICG